MSASEGRFGEANVPRDQAPAAVEGASDTQPPGKHIETIAAVVLAIAVVATAWCAYQATRWGGISATHFNEASGQRSESLRSSTESGQRTIIDVTIAADWLSAALSGNPTLAADLRARMTPELDAAMKRWLGPWTPDQPLPAGGPFATGGYVAPHSAEAGDLEREAAATFDEGHRDTRRADNYVLTGVLFAMALFFSGIAVRFEHPKHATLLVVLAAAIVLAGICLLLLQPKSLSL